MPTKTPKSIVDKIAKDVTAAVNKPALWTWRKDVGATPSGGTPEAFAVTVRQDSDYYRELIKAANLQLD